MWLPPRCSRAHARHGYCAPRIYGVRGSITTSENEQPSTPSSSSPPACRTRTPGLRTAVPRRNSAVGATHAGSPCPLLSARGGVLPRAHRAAQPGDRQPPSERRAAMARLADASGRVAREPRCRRARRAVVSTRRENPRPRSRTGASALCGARGQRSRLAARSRPARLHVVRPRPRECRRAHAGAGLSG